MNFKVSGPVAISQQFGFVCFSQLLNCFLPLAGPDLARRINRALRRADQVECVEAEDYKSQRDWYVPIVADAEAGFGGALNCFELMKVLSEFLLRLQRFFSNRPTSRLVLPGSISKINWDRKRNVAIWAEK